MSELLREKKIFGTVDAHKTASDFLTLLPRTKLKTQTHIDKDTQLLARTSWKHRRKPVTRPYSETHALWLKQLTYITGIHWAIIPDTFDPILGLWHHFESGPYMDCLSSLYREWPVLITVGLNQGNQTKHLGLHYCYINCSLALPKTKGLFSAIAANQNQIEPRALPLSKTKQKPSHTRKYSPLHCPKCISWAVPLVSHSFPQPQSPPYANWKRRPPDRLFDGFIKKLTFYPALYFLEELCGVYLEYPLEKIQLCFHRTATASPPSPWRCTQAGSKLSSMHCWERVWRKVSSMGTISL